MNDVSEEEWDEECVMEEEDEVEKEGGSNSLTGFFCEKSGHNNDDGDDLPEDEDELWSASAQNGLQVLGGMVGIHSRPLPQSPVSACIGSRALSSSLPFIYY